MFFHELRQRKACYAGLTLGLMYMTARMILVNLVFSLKERKQTYHHSASIHFQPLNQLTYFRDIMPLRLPKHRIFTFFLRFSVSEERLKGTFCPSVYRLLPPWWRHHPARQAPCYPLKDPKKIIKHKKFRRDLQTEDVNPDNSWSSKVKLSRYATKTPRGRGVIAPIYSWPRY
jgi:hypothetical protein